MIEPVVGSFRLALDPSAAAGVPAHVTVHFPWVPLERIDESVIADVAEMVEAFPSFAVTFRELRWFNRDVLWLEPDPPNPFVALAAESARRWPDYPQYDGVFETVIPHLTVGVGDEWSLNHAEVALTDLLPMHGVADQVWWMTRTGADPWVHRRTFGLG